MYKIWLKMVMEDSSVQLSIIRKVKDINQSFITVSSSQITL